MNHICTNGQCMWIYGQCMYVCDGNGRRSYDFLQTSCHRHTPQNCNMCSFGISNRKSRFQHILCPDVWLPLIGIEHQKQLGGPKILQVNYLGEVAAKLLGISFGSVDLFLLLKIYVRIQVTARDHKKAGIQPGRYIYIWKSTWPLSENPVVVTCTGL